MQKLFTAENAKEMGRRGAAVSNARKAQRLAITATAPVDTGLPANQTGIDAGEIRGVVRHVIALALRTSDQDKLGALTHCFNGFWDALCTATGTSRPGPRKPAELKARGLGSLLGITLPVEPIVPASVGTNPQATQ